MQFFDGNDSHNVLGGLTRQLEDAILDLKPEDLDSTDRDEWVDYWENEYWITPVVIYSDAKELSLCEQTVRQYNTWHRFDNWEPEYFEVAGVKAMCRVPYSGTFGLFEMRPSTFTLCGHEAKSISKPSEDGIGYITFEFEQSLSSATPESIKEHFEDKIADFEKQIGYCNQDVERYNTSLRGLIEKTLDKRIDQVDQYASLRRGLDLPLNRVKDAPLAMPIPLIKKRLKISRPKNNPKSERSYSIDDSNYQHINDVIDKMAAMMERTPSAYSTLEEEQLRDILLSTLNSHYENLATGETFRKHGKADIQIPIDGHAAYIAECKIWKGQKKFREALGQLFSYTTWRDTKVSVIVFNKTIKNFETVLNAINDVLKEESISCKREKHTQWLCTIQNEADERIMHVTIQIFDLTT